MFSAFFPKQHCCWWGLSSLIREGWDRRRVDSIWASSGLPYGQKESIKFCFPQNPWEVILRDFTYKGSRWRWWFAVNWGIVTDARHCNTRTWYWLQIQSLVIQSFGLESPFILRGFVNHWLKPPLPFLKKTKPNLKHNLNDINLINLLLYRGSATVTVIQVSGNLKSGCMWPYIVWYYSQSHSRTQGWQKTHSKFLYKLMQKLAFSEGLP